MEFNCYVCKSSNFKVRASSQQIRFKCYGFDKNVIECCDCGLVQLYPQWSKEELNGLYKKYSLKKDFVGYKVPRDIHSYVKKYINKDDDVLEIGCGRGNTVRWLRDNGYNVIGLDRDPTVKDSDIVLNYEFEKFNVWNRFNFIYAIHVLEHIEEPVKFLNKIISYLKPNGKFLLEIPNVNDPLLSLYKNKAYAEFVWYPYHVYFYSVKTIKDLMSKMEGLEVKIVRKQRYGIINHLRWIFIGKPGNFNFHIPIIDDIYKFVLIKVFKVSDTLVILAQKKNDSK